MKRLTAVVGIWLSIIAALAGCQSKQPAPPATPAWTDPSPHREGFVTVGSLRLAYLDWGGSGTPLILIHGNGQNAHVYDDLALALGTGLRVIAYSRRGFGRSGKTGPFDTATFTEDLRALMDSLGIARAHLAGWSLGGNEITMMAGKYPDRVGKLVYLDAAYDWGDPALAAAFNALPISLAPPAAALASLDAYRRWYFETFLPTVANTAPMEAYLRDLVDVQPDGTVRPGTSDSVAAAVFKTVLTDRRDYTKVKAPALAIYSEVFLDANQGDSAQRAKTSTWERDHMIPFRTASIARIKRELKSPEVVTVPGAHPDFVVTARDQVAAAMRRFLK